MSEARRVPDTIFALSSGAPPAAIAVVRISGPSADQVLGVLTGQQPEPRHARLAAIKDPRTGELLDRALLLRFPGPASATGEDLVELHLHGGRAVVSAVLSLLGTIQGVREAESGEFTRRAFENGRIDLAEAEGLADLLAAETESQRRAALALAGGGLSRTVADWQEGILRIAAQVEAGIDFADEGDVEGFDASGVSASVGQITSDIRRYLDRPSAERLRDGIRVVIAGPPNAGKSSLLNWLAGRKAAITSAIAGTTRDLVEAPTALGGAPFLLVDTAGLRDSDDEVELIGVQRARETINAADLLIWLGEPNDCPPATATILVESKADLRGGEPTPGVHRVSAETGEGMNELVEMLIAESRALLPGEGELAINKRHRDVLAECLDHLRAAEMESDPILVAEALRLGRAALDRVTGRAGVENMLDALFGRFCIGK